MQYFVQANTPQDAVILAPYDMEMGGFRIFSERSVVVCYRDCGIVGFDFKAVEEWTRRLKDVAAFKLLTNSPPLETYKKAIIKYNASYIVFPRFYAPRGNETLEKIYANYDFALYKVNMSR